ncbi:hypothetical protein O7622_17290 [Micromonospora sp. WMMD1076]|uniref:hypothetical protein n=1 Tax=Micromonospora sp. WMMD1076 TaxID=3016103 RepID=UPI00249BFD6E|nr:hypothetical protein [Micromonospora sp. WMMD1076]WFF04824.1 hypothetical protein O7622_17290 [Micromonospora sp. WMMD1076]
MGLHAAVRHPAVVRPELVRDGTDGPTLVYPWCDGVVLNHATVGGRSDRSGLDRFQRLPVAEVRDEYRPGPFVLDSDRLPGSRHYLSPEELTRGASGHPRRRVERGVATPGCGGRKHRRRPTDQRDGSDNSA